MTDIKETKSDYMKRYYKTHPDIWSQKAYCEACDTEFNLYSKSNHVKTKRHELNSYKLKSKYIEEFIEKIKN